METITLPRDLSNRLKTIFLRFFSKLYLVLLILAFVPHANLHAQCGGDVVIDSHDFEANWGIWNDGGSDCRRSSNDAAFANSGTMCVRIRDDVSGNSNKTSMYTDVLNLTAYTELNVNFSFITDRVNNNEDFWVQYSDDGGASYTTYATYLYPDDFDNGVRYNPTVNIPGPFTSNSVIRIRCDASGNGDRVYIDDVNICGVVPSNDPPTPIVDVRSTPMDPLAIDVMSNDSDPNGDNIELSAITVGPSNGGSAIINQNGTPGDATDDYIDYTPANTGVETFTYEICDDGSPSECATAQVTVTVSPNTAPLANPDFDNTTADAAIAIDVLNNDNDADGHTITLTAITIPPNNGGSAVINNNGTPGNPADDFVDYTPEGTYTGPETFTYQICDDGNPNLCSTTTVTVTIAPNDAPIANPDAESTINESIAIDVLNNDSDPNGHNISITAITVAPNNGGSAVINDNGTPGNPADDFIDYSPSGSYFGVETFTYRICDDGAPVECATAVVTVTVTENQTPVATADADATDMFTGIQVDVLDNDVDPDGHNLTINAITVAPNNGGSAVINNNGTPGNPADDFIDYTPSGAFTGVETFTYQICDDGTPNKCATAMVSITVTSCVDGSTAESAPTWSFGAEWKYEDSGADLGLAWKAVGYSDACWSYGDAELGFGDGDETTVINDHDGITYYFRKHFNVVDRTEINNLFIGLKRDDGAIVHINGIEVYRTNMPTGAVNYNTPASSNQSGAEESAIHNVLVPASVLLDGDNVIAVEVHQDLATSSDITFDLSMSHTTVSADTVLVAAGQNWNYNDNGTDLGTAWHGTGIVETADEWESNNTEMGYGDGDEATVLDYGPDANNKYPTYYFRHYFVVDSYSPADQAVLKLRKDDGAVVYLNGTEIYRHGMPIGTVTYNTFADFTAAGADESNYYEYVFPATLLNEGNNVLAIEVHQTSGTSSDISFEAELHLAPITLTCDASETIEPSPNFNYGSEWRFWDLGALVGTSWQDVSYVDSCWSKGDGELGFGDGDETTLVKNHGGATYYFRKKFNVSSMVNIDNIRLNAIIDDGALIYVNGTEVWRNNMPNGTVTSSTLATAYAVEGTPVSILIPASVLTTGTNIIAVEVHQSGLASSDISFDMEMISNDISHPGNTIIPAKSVWNYNDNGIDLGTDWRNLAIQEDGNEWTAGSTEMGYGDGDELTTLEYGGDANNKYPTYYFRRYFKVNPGEYENYDSLWVKLRRDDAAVVYINGTEVFRSNFNESTIVNYNTYAEATVADADEVDYVTTSYPAAVLNSSGYNLIAVEMHQVSGTSSDISFELELELYDGNPGQFNPSYDNLSGVVYLDSDVSFDRSAGDVPQGAIEVWAYQDINENGSVDDTDPRLFSDFTKLDGAFKIAVYEPGAESRKSEVSSSADDAREVSSSGVVLLGETVQKSINYTALPTLVFDSLSVWKYYDNGALNDTSWRSPGFNDGGWSSGQGPLGFGDIETTTVNNHGGISYYFRKTVTMGPIAPFLNSALIHVKRDDAVVVYLNGEEIYRNNISGVVDPNTLADGKVEAAEENKYIEAIISNVSYLSGTNVFAVEIHQDGAASSDIVFDMRLSAAAVGVDDVALRFPNMDIPQGAYIVDAFLRLTPDGVSETFATIDIEGEDSDNAAAFTTVPYSISTRPRTTANETWASMTPFLDGREQEITGIRSIIQEIVDRPGWTPGNAMALFLSGYAAEFYTYDGGYAPELTVTFGDTSKTQIHYVLGLDPIDLPAQHHFLADPNPSATLITSGRAVGDLDIGYIGATSMCVATSDDSFDDLHVINRFSGKNEAIGITGTNMEIEAVCLSLNADTLYAVDGGQFGTIDFSTGLFTPYGGTIGTADGADGSVTLDDIDGLTFDITRNLIWASHRRGQPTHDLIFTIDRSTGQFIPDQFGPGVDYIIAQGGGLEPDIDDLALNPNTGNLFAMNNDNGALTYLTEINVTTGTPSTVGSTALNDMEGQGFHNDGNYYSTSGREGIPDNSFYQIDTTDASLTFIGAFNTSGDFEGCDCKSGPAVNFLDGYVYEDIDEDALFDQGIEPGQDSVEVFIYEDVDDNGIITREMINGRAPDILETTVMTGPDGYYAAGIYRSGNFIALVDTNDLPLLSELTTDELENARFPVNGTVDFFNNFGFRGGNVLPVELTEFRGQNEGTKNHLFWNTATEINNDYFDVQRSVDGSNFETIGRVEGAGNSLDPLDYSFIDENPGRGIRYYRLQQVDYDGTIDYSNVIQLQVHVKEEIRISSWPNPAQKEVHLDGLNVFHGETVTIRVYDAEGREYLQQVVTGEGDQTTLDVQSLKGGFYLIDLYSNALHVSVPLIKKD